jgi:uncharacterized protein YndB with AHSA1/START domain
MRATALTIALLALAGPAWAWELGPAAAEVLARGQPYVEVRSDPGGASGRVRAAIDIAAPPLVVWSAMTDCDLAPRMVASLKSCRVVARDPAGRWDDREYVSRMGLLPSLRTQVRDEFDPPRRMTFRRTSGDMKVLDGEWRLISSPDGAGTRVLYENRAAAPFAAPGFIARLIMRNDVPRAMLALRRESLARR